MIVRDNRTPKGRVEAPWPGEGTESRLVALVSPCPERGDRSLDLTFLRAPSPSWDGARVERAALKEAA